VNQHETLFTTHFGVDFTNKQLGYMLKGHCITMQISIACISTRQES